MRALPPPLHVTSTGSPSLTRSPHRLATPGCKNQGWFLDGFPKNAAQARLLFNLNDAPAEAKPADAEGGDGEAEAAPAEASDDAPVGPVKVAAPEIIVQIDAAEDFLLHRVMAYAQDKVRVGL